MILIVLLHHVRLYPRYIGIVLPRLTAVRFGPGLGVFCSNLEPTGSVRMANFTNLNLPPNLRFIEVQEVQQPGGVMYQNFFSLCLKSSIFQWLVALTRLSKHSIPSQTLQVQPHSEGPGSRFSIFSDFVNLNPKPAVWFRFGPRFERFWTGPRSV